MPRIVRILTHQLSFLSPLLSNPTLFLSDKAR